MYEYFPLLFVGGVIGVFSICFIIAFAAMKNKKEAIGFERYLADGEINKRLLRYARPHIGSFAFVLLTMAFSISYDIAAPIIVSNIENIVKANFELPVLYTWVAIYGSILVVSLVCTYIQSIVLQKTGQKILSKIRQDAFAHIESLSHEQLNEIPVGKLVTRVTNDTNSISMMFTESSFTTFFR